MISHSIKYLKHRDQGTYFVNFREYIKEVSSTLAKGGVSFPTEMRKYTIEKIPGPGDYKTEEALDRLTYKGPSALMPTAKPNTKREYFQSYPAISQDQGNMRPSFLLFLVAGEPSRRIPGRKVQIRHLGQGIMFRIA